jgi:hypothetical protein
MDSRLEFKESTHDALALTPTGVAEFCPQVGGTPTVRIRPGAVVNYLNSEEI